MNLPPKKIFVKSYTVREHYRTVWPRTYKLICAHCELEAERITYATTCPKYCDRCKDLKKKLGKKKQASGEVVEVANDGKDTSNKPVEQLPQVEKVADAIRDSLKQSLSVETPKVTNPKSTNTGSNRATSGATTQEKVSSKKTTKKAQTLEAKVEELDSERLVEYINQLLLVHYNSKLNSDSKNMLVDLWERKNYDQIQEQRGLRVKVVRKIASNLLEQLSNAMGENVTPRNLHEVMNKHYRADRLISG